ncbi:WD40-like Beta Propeller Repeat [Reichenbachiella agariperforans]|uniref:WD40-like Beta Propeller Repeat n=1 Tax=Reichenbachiella agariperforans TaxID=156994 RepID=A0A1M6JEM6_REIAG|nr:OmpA family protein [Reichenbachiella agariperforans]SHJ45104.1 WD40-like Beta Propeller Repeat [Reichenbachiella agariperforans]
MKQTISYYLFIFSFLLVSGAMAQTTSLDEAFKSAYKNGVKAYKAGDYKGAVDQFQEALKYRSSHENSWYYAGMAFVNDGNPERAIYCLKRLENINPDYNPWVYSYIGNAYLDLDDLRKAEDYYQKFYDNLPKDPKGVATLHLARNRIEYAKRSPEIRASKNSDDQPLPLANVNSSLHDYTPQVNPTGTRLYFTSVRQGGFDYIKDSTRLTNYGEDVYYSSYENDVWQKPVLMPEPINSMSDDFGSSFTGDGQTMVYVRCGTDESIGGCDLYIAYLESGQWSEPKNMGNVVNSGAWDSQPTISSDGTRIIFSSTRDGGYGESDLYVTSLNQYGEWGIPSNLGSTVNTPLSDKSPYLASDGKSLYYATEGHPGYGESDIFYSLFDNGKWGVPINVGAPINSSGDDTNFSISASGMGYFASSRLDAANYDIFEMELPDHLKPKPSMVVQGIVSNANTSAPIGAVVLVEDMVTGELIALNKSNDETGEYLIVLPAGRSYSVSATKDGYFFYSQSFDLPDDASYAEITKDILLEPIEKGTKVVLNNIFFESGRAELKPISYVELNKAVQLLKDNGTMVIEVGGYTDNVGSDELNLKLSQARADAVVAYMVLAGVEQERLRSKGYGESSPIEDNATEEGRKANRRTEFVIVEF